MQSPSKRERVVDSSERKSAKTCQNFCPTGIRASVFFDIAFYFSFGREPQALPQCLIGRNSEPKRSLFGASEHRKKFGEALLGLRLGI